MSEKKKVESKLYKLLHGDDEAELKGESTKVPEVKGPTSSLAAIAASLPLSISAFHHKELMAVEAERAIDEAFKSGKSISTSLSEEDYKRYVEERERMAREFAAYYPRVEYPPKVKSAPATEPPYDPSTWRARYEAGWSKPTGPYEKIEIKAAFPNADIMSMLDNLKSENDELRLMLRELNFAWLNQQDTCPACGELHRHSTECPVYEELNRTDR